MFTSGIWYIGNTSVTEDLAKLGLQIVSQEEDWENDYIKNNLPELNSESVYSVFEAVVLKENLQLPSDYPGEQVYTLQVPAKVVTTVIYHGYPMTWSDGGYTGNPQPCTWAEHKNYLVIE